MPNYLEPYEPYDNDIPQFRLQSVTNGVLGSVFVFEPIYANGSTFKWYHISFPEFDSNAFQFLFSAT
jgi:hypothetical protein